MIVLTRFQVIYLQAFVFVILMGKLLRKIFFGQLRAAEMEVSGSSKHGVCFSKVTFQVVVLVVSDS